MADGGYSIYSKLMIFNGCYQEILVVLYPTIQAVNITSFCNDPTVQLINALRHRLKNLFHYFY